MNKKLRAFINVVLFALLITTVFVLALCVRGEWTLSGYKYSDDIKDVIRIFSVFELFFSVILQILNKNKCTLTILLVANGFVLYKFLSTYFGF